MQFCPRGCMEIPSDSYGPAGYKLAVFAYPERCNTCGFCAQMCPFWAIEVYLAMKEGESVTRQRIAGPAEGLGQPLSNCSGCQNPVIGRIIAEVISELGIGGDTIALEAIQCNCSSVLGVGGMGSMLSVYERPIELASRTKGGNTDTPVLLVLSAEDGVITASGGDSLIGALTLAENYTIIMCNNIYCGPGRAMLGKGAHLAELAATFEGVVYSSRSSLTSLENYQLTRSHIRTALQKQIENAGMSFVEILTVCWGCIHNWLVDRADCLAYVRERTGYLPLGEIKNAVKVE